MSEHNGFRLGIIVSVLLAALAIVFSPVLNKLFHPKEELNSWVSLKPGIDMVGGTSLVYEIIKPEGYRGDGNLATKVAEILKKRVDPTGTQNLVWRPQGDSRLEIQKPLSLDAPKLAEQRKQLREQMIGAQDALNATNVQTQTVIDAVKGENGHLQAELAKLANGDPARKALFDRLSNLWNQIQSARKAQDADKQARLEIEFDNALHPKTAAGAPAPDPIAATNLAPEQVDQALALSTGDKDDKNKPDERKAALDELRGQNAKFPARLAALDRYIDVATRMSSAKDSIDDATDLKRKLRGAGVLEYHILADDMGKAEYQKYIDHLHQDGPRLQAGDQARWFEVDKPEDFHHHTESYNKKQYVLGWITPIVGPDGQSHRRSLDAHTDRPWHLTDAMQETQTTGEMVVGFQFDPQGAQYFGELTEFNKDKPMAIVLDGKVISAPNINSKITSSGIITGGGSGFTQTEMDYLVSTLKAGSLPASLSDQPISEKTVGPQLGQANLRAGLVACGLGLVVVAVFLCSYYFLAGLIATGAVVMNVLIVLAVMSSFGATFTLPSIAGIVLSVGTAVDANVLIFERLREEQHRGLSLRLALRNAYGKAFSAIIDSNMTTAITSLFLIWFGTEEVKGFGVTLIIGIIASLFTALFVTRAVFGVLMDNFGVKQLRSLPLVFPRWDKALRPNIDWMGKAWAFIAFSIVGITVGLILFFVQVHKGQMMGIEFASGTSVEFEVKNAMDQGKLQDLVLKNADPHELPSPEVVTVGTDHKTFQIVSPSANATEVRDAVLKALVDTNGHSLLRIDVPSKFAGSDNPAADELHKAVLPLDKAQTAPDAKWPGGFRPDNAKDYEGGVAIVLDHLDPPLSPGQISDRIRQAQVQLASNSPEAHLDFTVDSAQKNAEAPTSQAVILSRDPAIPYSKDPGKWQETLATPLWQLVKDSVNRPAQLQQVRNFDPQVAGDATRDATMALVFSILVIMAYIWFRFGNLKYGTATMAALIHDVLFTIAALGFAHYLWNVPGIGWALQLEPFRIDLTVVAGILTIMGYSMIDTIVVFDRIRENRGKFGIVSRKVINDAINQTLSRTLLTAGTNVVTVAIMYFLGGPGIHGFTFVLLFGIIVGTYSSIAIAAPILLLGRREESVATHRAPGRLQRAGA
ncbi:MAG TPA: protein translocase subunit SecD [Tepidisphaeraceae bacterium]|nr:protein translocase subunit SecD [Tepidisphaeraceae bacterium]